LLHELRAKPRDRELLAAFAPSVSGPVVEIGCGPGQIGAFVRQRGRKVFGLDELVDARRSAGLGVTLAERRMPYPSEYETVRLYVEATSPKTNL
jgi:trans-aconitate methyltransferase